MTMPLRAMLLLLALAALPGQADSRPDERLAAVTALRVQAEAANALQLAPQSYRQGVQSLERARRDAEAGADPQRVAARLTEARAHFENTLTHLPVARLTFAGVLQGREAAQQAQAFRFAGERWIAAEQLFGNAAERLERGDLEGARRGAAAAAEAYDEAELAALRMRYLAGARGQLAEAERLRAARHAPRTLARARALLARAEQALAENRTRPETAAGPVQEATAAAGHVLQLARIGTAVQRRERSLEEVILELEDGIARMAAAAGLSADFSRPHAETSAGLAGDLAAQRSAAEAARQDLADRSRLVLGLEEEIRELQERLGMTGVERDELMRTMQAQARVREQFGQVEGLFTPDQARVLREGEQLIIRLTGLSFRSGSAELPREAAGLLNKVEQAIAIFPRAAVQVEGHTDATGSDAANQRLSEARALAVAQHLTGQLRLAPGQIQATGFGPSRPIANNATEAGRAQNRRIDVIITPNLRQPAF